MNKKISIIIPVYNTEKYIEKCLDSVKKQTYKNIEVIIVNDGSTDNSEKVIKEWIEKNKNSIEIKYFMKENGGLSDARNFGVEHADGEYISFLDSDDYLEEHIYENLEKHMNEESDLIKFKMKTVDENDKLIQELDGPIFDKCSGPEAFEKLYATDTFMEVSCIYLYRTDFYKNNKFQFELNRYHEDFGLIPWILINAKTVISTPYFGYNYLQRSNSITDETNTEKENKKAYDILQHYDNAIERINRLQIEEKYKDKFKTYYTNVLLLRVHNLTGKQQQDFIKCIKMRKVYKNLKIDNLKQLLKKILVIINIKLYLKLR